MRTRSAMKMLAATLSDSAPLAPITRFMRDDIDIDCGTIATGETSIEQKGEEILTYLLEVASGRKSKSEELGYGGVEFVPWQVGAVM